MTIFDIEQGYYNLQMKKNDIQKIVFLINLELYKQLMTLIELK